MLIDHNLDLLRTSYSMCLTLSPSPLSSAQASPTAPAALVPPTTIAPTNSSLAATAPAHTGLMTSSQGSPKCLRNTITYIELSTPHPHGSHALLPTTSYPHKHHQSCRLQNTLTTSISALLHSTTSSQPPSFCQKKPTFPVTLPLLLKIQEWYCQEQYKDNLQRWQLLQQPKLDPSLEPSKTLCCRCSGICPSIM